MTRVLLALILSAAVLMLAWWIALLPGTVSLEIGEFAIEAPVPVAGLGAIGLFVLL